MWAMLAGLLAVCGVAASGLGASSLARSDASRSLKSTQQSSAQIASTLQLAIQHEQDLLAAAMTGFILGDPTASNAEFVHWAATVQAIKRYLLAAAEPAEG
jgi:hypothetical protein